MCHWPPVPINISFSLTFCLFHLQTSLLILFIPYNGASPPLSHTVLYPSFRSVLGSQPSVPSSSIMWTLNCFSLGCPILWTPFLFGFFIPSPLVFMAQGDCFCHHDLSLCFFEPSDISLTHGNYYLKYYCLIGEVKPYPFISRWFSTLPLRSLKYPRSISYILAVLNVLENFSYFSLTKQLHKLLYIREVGQN